MAKSKKWIHWTEKCKAVQEFLRDEFGAKPVKQKDGADFVVGNVTVEIKACMYKVKDKHANGKCRFGRFRINAEEMAKYYNKVVFVVVRNRKKQDLMIKVLDRIEIQDHIQKRNATIPWKKIFGEVA